MNEKVYKEMKERTAKRTALYSNIRYWEDKIARIEGASLENETSFKDGMIEKEEYDIEWARCRDLLKYYRNKKLQLDIEFEKMTKEEYTEEMHKKEITKVMEYEAAKSELTMIGDRIDNLNKAMKVIGVHGTITFRKRDMEQEIFLFSAEEVGAICQGLQHIINNEHEKVARIKGEMEAI